MKNLTPIALPDQEDQDVDYSELYKDGRVILGTKPPKPPKVLTYGYSDNGYEIGVCHREAVSALVGMSKSFKSRMAIINEALYLNGSTEGFDGFKGYRSGKKWLLHFDTEQAKYLTYRTREMLYTLSGHQENVEVISLVNQDVEERVGMIEWALFDSPMAGNIGWVTIDQIADLVRDENNLVQSKELAHKLLKWANMADCHIQVVIHSRYSETPGALKATGHLGSSIIKKCETVMGVRRDAESFRFKVSPDACRHYPFSDFEVEINKDNIPQLASEDGFFDD